MSTDATTTQGLTGNQLERRSAMASFIVWADYHINLMTPHDRDVIARFEGYLQHARWSPSGADLDVIFDIKKRALCRMTAIDSEQPQPGAA